MKIIIDERERDLFMNCYSIINSNNSFIQLSKEVLPLGDIFIKTDENKDVMIIERKSLQDLLASIKDGRYEEQSYRLLHSSGFPPHSILYIIEGNINELRTPMEKRIVYSALTSLNYFKGFSVIRTSSIKETAEYIFWMSEKIEKNFLKSIFPYYLQPQFCNFMQKPIVSILEPPIETTYGNEDVIIPINEFVNTNNVINNSDNIYNRTEQNHDETTVSNYCTVVKKVKKDNITPENIGEIILCQIPTISSVSAISIMKKFKTFPNLMKEININVDCLNDIVCENKGGKPRKLAKNCIDNIKKYLLENV